MNMAINNLQNFLKEQGIDAYIVPTNDYHGSEYLSNFFKTREYLSGFTGSAGTLVITQNQVCLWTDGRYFLQAEEELKNSNIILYKMYEPNVPTIMEFLNNYPIIGFDGKTISAMEGILFESRHNEPRYKIDLVDRVWPNRPSLPKTKAFRLPDEITMISAVDKLTSIREKIELYHANSHFLTTLDDIAWTLNLRGHDVDYNPVNLAVLYITMNEAFLFMDEEKLTPEIKALLPVTILPYNKIDAFIKGLDNQKILVDYRKINYAMYKNLCNNDLINAPNPSTLMKAIKNEWEIRATKNAHHKDGIAVTKFIYWLKNNIGKTKINEMDIACKLYQLRSEQKEFIEPSFSTIAGYNEHGAIIHYEATEKTYSDLQAQGLLLVDSGGHYIDGTTDITRTIALGCLTPKMKEHYTLVLKGLINLSTTTFMYGCRGSNLDILAHQALWQNHLDYRHGSGHGVGFVLNVHEGPNNFRWKARQDDAILEPGMITTIEPGFYQEGEYGIRLENELLCKASAETEYGNFCQFETLTFAPFDIECILPSLLTDNEKQWLNEYHQNVYLKIAPFLNEDEQKWLKKNTSAI